MGTAIFKQKNALYALVAVASCGLISAEQLDGLNRLVQAANVNALKMTARQTLILLAEEDEIANLTAGLERIGFKIGVFNNAVRNVKACSGNDDLCPRAVGDALGLGIAIQEKYYGQQAPHDFKIAAAGCSRGCTDPLCADFGVMCKNSGSFDIYIGGKGSGRKPLHGQMLVSGVSYDQVFASLEFVLDRYRELASGKERLHHTIERVGMDKFAPPLGSHEAAAAVDEDFLNMLNSEGAVK